MFFKPIHIFLITLAALLFSFQKSNATTQIYLVNGASHSAPENISGSRHQTALQIIADSLTDSDEDNGDDETSSHARHRIPKLIVSFPTKFNTLCCVAPAMIFNQALRSFASPEKQYNSVFLLSKTSISIAIRCLRI